MRLQLPQKGRLTLAMNPTVWTWPENVTAPEKLLVRFKLETSYAPFFAAIPSVCIVNPRVIKAHEKDGDWAKAWLASNGAGSGAYRIVSEGYRPLEFLDMDIFDGHFLGWKHNPKPVRKIAVRSIKETSTRILALLNISEGLAMQIALGTSQVETVGYGAAVAVAPYRRAQELSILRDRPGQIALRVERPREIETNWPR